jgi:hypothetical protein
VVEFDESARIISMKKTLDFWAGYEHCRQHQQRVIDELIAVLDAERVNDLLFQVDTLKSLVDAYLDHHKETHSLCRFGTTSR